MLMRAIRGAVSLELIAGAVASVGLTGYAAVRVGAPAILHGLFAAWVLLPYIALAAAIAWTTERSVTRRALEVITPVVALVSVAVYAAVALGAARPRTAVFVLVPPASLIVIGVARVTIALLSRGSTSR